jgi:hypothetical protein
MQLIAFTAPKESGKSLLADYLVAEHGYTKLNFKDALIDEIKERFPMLLKEISEDYVVYEETLFTEKPYPPIIRLLLQEYGTEVRRADDPDYWVDAWLYKANELKRAGITKIVVDDVRFRNEAHIVWDEDGTIIRITRPDYEESGDTHTSETEQASIAADHTIINDGTQEDLINKLKALLAGNC